jgi:LPS sulfotransferase NodH
VRGVIPLRLPSFIVVGAARTGTTWLNRVLTNRVGLPRGTKETDFFIKRYHMGLSWYASHFRRCAADVPIGEICPTYFDSALARERIALHIPACKIVIVLRDPVARLYSLYKLLRMYAWTKVGFEEAILKNRQMLDSSRYAYHVRQWQERFGAANVLVMIHDDLRSDPQAFVDRICEFIGLKSFALHKSELANNTVNDIPRAPWSRRLARDSRNVLYWLNSHRFYRLTNLWRRSQFWWFCFGSGEAYPRLTPAQETRLRRRLTGEVDRLEKLLGRDLPAWKEPAAEKTAYRGGQMVARA